MVLSWWYWMAMSSWCIVQVVTNLPMYFGLLSRWFWGITWAIGLFSCSVRLSVGGKPYWCSIWHQEVGIILLWSYWWNVGLCQRWLFWGFRSREQHFMHMLLAMPSESIASLQGMKMDALEQSWSIFVRIVLYPCDSGSFVIKSSAMVWKGSVSGAGVIG
jgi:hypothetical protein